MENDSIINDIQEILNDSLDEGYFDDILDGVDEEQIIEYLISKKERNKTKFAVINLLSKNVEDDIYEVIDISNSEGVIMDKLIEDGYLPSNITETQLNVNNLYDQNKFKILEDIWEDLTIEQIKNLKNI